MRRISIVVAVLAWVLAGPAVSSARAANDYGSQLGWGVAAIGANLFYIPTKLVYAMVGGVTGGLGYALTAGNQEVLHTILSPAVGGTYVLSPRMVRGDDPIFFSGESYESCEDCPAQSSASRRNQAG